MKLLFDSEREGRGLEGETSTKTIRLANHRQEVLGCFRNGGKKRIRVIKQKLVRNYECGMKSEALDQPVWRRRAKKKQQRKAESLGGRRIELRNLWRSSKNKAASIGKDRIVRKWVAERERIDFSMLCSTVCENSQPAGHNLQNEQDDE